MPTMPGNIAAAKTFQQLQALGVSDANSYLESLKAILDKIEVTILSNLQARNLTLSDAINLLVTDFLKTVSLTDKRLIVVGNGASAAIALHTLADYANAGGLKTVDLFSPTLLTCMANDYGYENVFSKPIEILAEQSDILFAISSSGKSPNILNACESALAKKCQVVTFSGFSPDNPLRKLGRLNFYVPSSHYGFVEISHQTLIHCILDLFVRAKVYEEVRELIG